MSSAHSPTFPSLHLRHNSFSYSSVALPTSQLIADNLSVTSPSSQLILQIFRRFTYVTAHCRMSRAHSPTFPSLHLRHNSFSNSSVALPTSQFILQPFVASPTTQLILQPFFRFYYLTGFSLTSLASRLCIKPIINNVVLCYLTTAMYTAMVRDRRRP